MPNSQNGWPVVGTSAIVDKSVLGVEFPNGWLKGDVDVIFTDLISRLDKIERIDNGGCWGYFVKGIEGSSSISNHASGTAIDYNAPDHPMGTRNTYSAAKRAAIHSLLKRYDGVIRWGGDYTGRPDDMHFEINDDKAAVHKVAEKISNDTGEVRGVALPEYGDKSEDVSYWQLVHNKTRLAFGDPVEAIEVDGDYGPSTASAIAKVYKRLSGKTDFDGKIMSGWMAVQYHIAFIQVTSATTKKGK